MALVTVTAPTWEPVSLEDIREHLREESDDLDPLILGALPAAREFIERTTRRSLSQAQLRYIVDGFPGSEDDYTLELPRSPVSAVASVKYDDTADAEQTLATSVYDADLNSTPAVITLAYGQSWPATRDKRGAVRVEYTAGYASLAAVPALAKHAIRLLVAHYIEQPEPVLALERGRVEELPFSLRALLDQLEIREIP